MKYQPQPIPTATIELPGELLSLVERLAANNHDVWALARLEQGWCYGEARNDSLKTHPDLIPYPELQDQEKDVDRQTVLETLKAIVALGYRILPPDP